jgi:hypothetical protein
VKKIEKLFLVMLEKCQKYALAINAKGKPFPTEPLIMALLLEQHKMIKWLQEKISIPNKGSSSGSVSFTIMIPHRIMKTI